MKIFVSNSVVLFILVVSTTIDASRIFYFPLPKLPSLHQETQKTEPTKKTISDEFIPPSAIEQEEIEKRGDNFDWEALLDKQAEANRRTTVDELLPESLRRLSERYRWHESIDKTLNNDDDDDERQKSIKRISQFDEDNFLEEPWVIDHVNERAERLQSNGAINSIEGRKRRNDALFIVIVGVCCAVGVVGLMAAAVFWYRVQKKAESAADTDYPSYGVTGPNTTGSKLSPSSSMSDRKLAQSAQMFHYQQQRQQMMAQEKAHLDAKPTNSDDSDDEAPAGGDYTVYECPGLAPTGEMEVRNPLFAEPDSSLISQPTNPESTTNNTNPQASTAISPQKEKLLP